MRRFALALAAAALLAGCSWCGGGKSESGAGSTQAPAAKESRTPLQEAADKLLETDRAFAAKSLDSGTGAAFSQFLDEQGMLLPANSEPIVGRKAVADSLASVVLS